MAAAAVLPCSGCLIYPTYDGADDRYFAGTSTGLYSTALLDGDNTVWEQEGPTTIGNTVINMIAARNYDGLIAVGTHGSGVVQRAFAGCPHRHPRSAVPELCRLSESGEGQLHRRILR
jgi:hypothetical protein